MSQLKRAKYSDSQQLALATQVDSRCPLCNNNLFYQKKGRSYKGYDLAHIFPLNPTKAEKTVLKGAPKLSIDPNHEDNLIPLCDTCHRKFDNPRTLEEYTKLFDLKSRILDQERVRTSWMKFPIEDQLSQVIHDLCNDKLIDSAATLSFQPASISDKTDDSIPKITIRRIRNDVSEYFTFIRTRFADLDKSHLDLSTIVSTQVKACYIKLKASGLTKKAIYDGITDWIAAKTSAKSRDAAEILTAYFIQNCEVFE